jgi:hypothetical protein
MLLNNRFVVPTGMVDNMTKFATLHDALTKPGLNAGDMIQIEPGSSPGQLLNADVPGLKNLTIQGDSAFDVQSIPFFVANALTIGSAQQGFTLKNVQVDIQNGTFQLTTDATITDCHIKNDFDGIGISLQGASATVVSNSYIENANPQDQQNPLVKFVGTHGSHNRITDNQFVATTGIDITLLDYSGGTSTTDLVAHNSFTLNVGFLPLLHIEAGTDGLIVLGNTLTDYDPASTGIKVDPTVENLQIVDNVISLPKASFSARGILVMASQSIFSTTMVIANNHIQVAGGEEGIEFDCPSPGSTLIAKVEGNDLHGDGIGIFIGIGFGGSAAGIDLGGGAQGSMGANNFRGDATAIVVEAPPTAGPIQAQNNIFGVADPETVILDHHVDQKLATVVATNPLTGNAAYVETLYLDFLHRTGNLSDPKDSAIWVTRMGQGMSAATVADLVARSPEGLGVAVDGLYHRFLGRDADAAGRTNFVAYLQNGGTLEGASQILLASPEYQSRFPTDSSFVQSLYQNLLHRTGSTAEVNAWVAQLPQLGRAGVAQVFLLSQEYRADEVSDDYTWFLHRTGSTADINSWVNSGQDILTIDILFAGSQEFQHNG